MNMIATLTDQAVPFLPNTKYQLIGFGLWLTSQMIMEYLVGRSTRIPGSNILDAIVKLVSAVRGKKKENKDV